MERRKTRVERLMSDQLHEKLDGIKTDVVGDLYTPVKSDKAQFLDVVESVIGAEEPYGKVVKRGKSGGVLFTLFICIFVIALIVVGFIGYRFITSTV